MPEPETPHLALPPGDRDPGRPCRRAPRRCSRPRRSRSSPTSSARFAPARRASCSRAAREVQARLDAGERLDFLAETAGHPRGRLDGRAAPAGPLDRRVEITGPVDRKMIINALNSGANVFMADFEDSNRPTWDNLVEGQVNLLRRGARHDHATTTPERQGATRSNEKTATLMVRPRGWHLPEKHVLVDGKPDARRALRLRPLLLPQRARAARARHRAVLLPAEAGEPPRGAALERRLRARAGARSASRAAPSRRRC